MQTNHFGPNRLELPEAFKKQFDGREIDELLWKLLAHLDSKAPDGYALRIPSFCYLGKTGGWFAWGLDQVSLDLRFETKEWAFLAEKGDVWRCPYTADDWTDLEKWMKMGVLSYLYGPMEVVQKESIDYQTRSDLLSSDSESDSYERI